MHKFVNFKVKCAPKMEFSEGRRGSKQNPAISSIKGGVYIFSGTVQLRTIKMYTLHCTCVEHEEE